MSKKTFNITATMEEKHVDRFCSMLKYMENFDDTGEHKIVGMGCGDNRNFHPKFDIDMEFNSKQPKNKKMIETNTVREYARNLCDECGKKLAGFLNGYKLTN